MILPVIKQVQVCTVQELRSSSTLFRYFDWILFKAVNFEFIVEKVGFCEICYGLVWIDDLDHSCFALVEFGLVWSGCFTDKQTNNNYLILINFICECVFGYSTDKKTNKIII